MSKLKPTEQRVLDYLNQNKDGLTVLDCIRKLKTTELRKIVSTLNRHGFNVASVWESGINSFGENTHYKRYFLITKGATK